MSLFFDEQLKNKNVVILGAGITGLSCARYLKNNNIAFALNDSRKQPVDPISFAAEFSEASLYLGQWQQRVINQADVLIVSPGIDLNTPDIAQSINSKTDVLGDVELYCRVTNVPTIAVTGSNGKSTVVSLLAYLGEALGYQTQLGGNIGVPVLDTIAKQPDFLILELSSFQLETLNSMKALSATVLNLCDDHLDRHETMKNYQNIKQKIYQQSNVAVVNRDDDKTAVPTNTVVDTVLSFGSDQPSDKHFGLKACADGYYLMQGHEALIAVNQLPIAGLHNAMNCLAALALGSAAGWSIPAMVAALPQFKGLAHRCQTVVSTDGVLWVNDSKATNVGATLAAINGFAVNKIPNSDLYLIAGGDAKGADLSALSPVLKQNIKQMVTLGKDGDKLACLMPNTIKVSNLTEAVKAISECTKPGDIVLLSPACASIDMFKNYAERGLAFEQAVQQVQG